METIDVQKMVEVDETKAIETLMRNYSRAELVMMCATRMLDSEGTKRELAQRIVESGQ